jgi:alkanesulfonate monooxygenase SsuD/methylene tetrahydromethanopterin reductase-like flavin-dependent oxidoreductase (luciferase family)
VFVCPTADATVAREIGRRLIAAYLTVPAYAAFHVWLGRGEALRPMQDAWAAGYRKGALAAVTDHLVDELVVHGRPEDCRERVEQYRASGLDTPVVMVVPTPGVDEVEAVRQLAPPR